jgi:hypothetical protein
MMARLTVLVAMLGAAASGFFGARAPLRACRTTASARCASPLVMASNDESWNSWDDAALREHMNLHRPSAHCGPPERVLRGLKAAYVLIFNAGMADEGVYTLQGQAAAASAYVLAFELTDDADRFAQLLMAEGFDLATPLLWETNQLSAFCEAGEFEVSLVPQGAMITPPTKNEYDNDAFNRVEGADAYAGLDAYAQQRATFERLFNEGQP